MSNDELLEKYSFKNFLQNLPPSYRSKKYYDKNDDRQKCCGVCGLSSESNKLWTKGGKLMAIKNNKCEV